MTKRFLLFLIFFLQVGTFVASADSSDQTLYQVITTQDFADFTVDIPTDLDPGFRSITVLVSDDSGIAQKRTLYFCKNLEGEIHWNNICPDLTPMASQAVLEATRLRINLPNYDPISQPKKTVGTIVVAFAALSVLSAGGAATLKSSPSKTDSAPSQGSGFLSQISAGALIAMGGAAIGMADAGDTRPTRLQRARNLPTSLAQKVSGFSPILGRIISSGNYLRAIFADAAYLLYPLALGIGFIASKSVLYQAMPPSLYFVFALVALGSLDAFAGLLAALAFTLPALFTGHVNSLHTGLTLAGISLLAFAPALIAGAFRPLRRSVQNFESLWERSSDYLLAAVLTAWIVRQMVQGLPGLAGVQLPITTYANSIALFAGGMISLRLIGEDVAMRRFSTKHGYAEPIFKTQNPIQIFLSDVMKTFVFVIVAEPFIGFSIELWIGTAIFALPFLLDLIDSHFPKSRWTFRLIPTGTVAILFMTTLGGVLTLIIQSHLPNPRTFILVSFVLLSIPGLVLRFFASFADDSHEEWRDSKAGSFFYRSAGVMVFALLVVMFVRGSLIS